MLYITKWQEQCAAAALHDDVNGCVAPACRQHKLSTSPEATCIYATPGLGFDSCCLYGGAAHPLRSSRDATGVLRCSVYLKYNIMANQLYGKLQGTLVAWAARQVT